ncbi:TfoX/Sxy family protein [Chitinibacter sp. SCUT-21]|uniref:TfoX/Sxy family protein n=1 Tax=Chitinibacter sp. SCUT-21 TaxID=2970891 RepID=UPI0035A740E3
MAKSSEFVSFLLEQLAPLGHVRAKSMFGSFGLYADELFFAIVADDILYLKADDINRAQFEALHLAPFQYAMKDGRVAQLNFYPIPEAALEEPVELLKWAREGVAAALRAPERKKSKKSKT